MNAPPSDLASDVGREIVKAVPPATVWMLTLNEWLAVASIIYIALQSAYLVRKWLREERRRSAGE